MEAARIGADGVRRAAIAPVYVHLRSAWLVGHDIGLIAELMRSLERDEAQLLSSVSLSKSRKVGDVGAAQMAESLPVSLTELGLVGCGIGDSGGKAVLEWMRRTTRLDTLCIEGNQFSSNVTRDFKSSAPTCSTTMQRRPGDQ